MLLLKRQNVKYGNIVRGKNYFNFLGENKALKNNKYKKYLCVFDLDGTLLNSEKKITERNKKAISVLQELGVGVIVATGRNKIMADIFLSELNLNMPLISNNGALVTHEQSDEPIYINAFSQDIRDKIILRCHERNLEYLCYSYKNIYVSSKFKKIDIAHLKNAVLENKTGDFITLPESAENVLRFFKQDNSSQVLKVLTAYPEDEDIKYFNSLKGVNCVFSQAVAVDIMPEGTNKGKALEKIAKILEYEQKNIFAFGDYDNDYEMLLFSGHPIAMGNAVDELKKIAKHIALSCDEDGVGIAIEEYVIPIVMGK